MWEYHVQLQSLTHFKLLMELQEIFPHFGNYSFYCVDVQGVAVHKSVQKIDVLRYSIKRKWSCATFLHSISRFVFVVLKKLLLLRPVEISTTTRALNESESYIQFGISVRKCLNVHTVCTNFGLNLHTPVYNRAQNDLKTLPMGILLDYMSCWTTLGAFQRPS